MRSLALAGALLTAATAAAESRHITVEDAVQLALATNPAVRARALRGEIQRDQARSVRGHMGPSFALSEEYQHYDSPFAIPFSIPGVMGPPASLRARDQDTNTFVVSAQQRLSGLFLLAQNYSAQRGLADAEDLNFKAYGAQTRLQVRVGFLRLFEAKALEEIARSSQAQLNEQVTVAKAKVKAGVLTTADLLRVQVASANARLQEIQARTQGDTTRASLLTALGFQPDDASLTFDEPRALLDGGEARPQYSAAAARALRGRSELAALRQTAAAYSHLRRAKMLALMPDVTAEAAYMRVDGQVFAPVNSAYVGIKAQWAIWEWGADYYQERAAKLQTDAARLLVEDGERGVTAEVKSDLDQAEAAGAAVEVAKETIASAEEAFRVMRVGVEAGAATTTDLLDAQAALTQAKLNLTRAQYQWAIARVTLARAMGE